MSEQAGGEGRRQPEICRARILHSGATHLCRCASFERGESCELRAGDMVVIQTKYGNDLGRIQGTVGSRAQYEGEDIVRVRRKATESDLRRSEENQAREREAFDICHALIQEQNLSMKLVSAHYLLDEPRLLFFFTAEERVDFRDLVRDLVAAFRMRVELRQIGVRDEARVLGGLGGCSRPFCCTAVTDRLQPVSIKMAKEQNLTLNSMKISGPCGRLLCCLAYEYDTYRDARQRLPKRGTEIHFDGESFRVEEANVLSGKVRLASSSGRVLTVASGDLVSEPGRNKWRVRDGVQESGKAGG